jgi:hypothetical protein
MDAEDLLDSILEDLPPLGTRVATRLAYILELIEYADHLTDCSSRQTGVCSCGLQEILTVISEWVAETQPKVTRLPIFDETKERMA